MKVKSVNCVSTTGTGKRQNIFTIEDDRKSRVSLDVILHRSDQMGKDGSGRGGGGGGWEGWGRGGGGV